MGADSQSPLGTAFAFSRPNNLALSLSNTSLLLEYTSRVFINSLQETGDNNRIKRQERFLLFSICSISKLEPLQSLAAKEKRSIQLKLHLPTQQVAGNRINVNIDDFADGLTNIDVTRVVSTTVPHDTCTRDENALPCDHTQKYRAYNGWCNNLNNPQYGKSVTPLIRFLSAKYDDGECVLP